MTLNIGKRMLMLLHWLCSVMIAAAFALCVIVPGLKSRFVARAESAMGPLGARIAGIVLLALYVALSVAQICMILGRKKKRAERGFIDVDAGDKGRVRIAVSAVEQMVRQSVRSIDGIEEMKVDIEGLEDAIAIGVNATIASGSHVPTITANMQRAITNFVEVNCGVSVQSIEITINAVTNQGGSGRRRLLGRGRDRDVAPVASVAPAANVAPVAKPAAQNAVDEAPAAIWRDPGETVAAADEAHTTESVPEEFEAPARTVSGYDPDAPYESEFAKDLAAMRAREASETDESAGGK